MHDEKRSQSSQSATALRLELGSRRLVLARKGVETAMNLRTERQLGVLAYLVDARLQDGAGGQLGHRSAARILAEAPGVETVKDEGRLGKDVLWRLIAKSKLGASLVESFAGLTEGPWRISIPPSDIVVDDRDALRRLLRKRFDAAAIGDEAETAPTQDDPIDLDEVAEMISRGADIGASRERVRAELRRAAASENVDLRAEAERLEALLLRRDGQIEEAKRRALATLDVERTREPPRPLDLAAALNELGAVHYREGDYLAARGCFDEELRVLEPLPAPGASGARSRAHRSLALAAHRLGEIDHALAAARAAQTAAREAADEVSWWLGRAVELRTIASRGGLEDAPYAAEQLLRAATLAPLTDPASLILIRRFYLETLYILGDHLVDAWLTDERLPNGAPRRSAVSCMEGRIAASDLAHALHRDGAALGSARDVDAVERLVREYTPGSVDAKLVNGWGVGHDRIEDVEAIRLATQSVGRPPRS